MNLDIDRTDWLMLRIVWPTAEKKLPTSDTDYRLLHLLGKKLFNAEHFYYFMYIYAIRFYYELFNYYIFISITI